MSSAGINIIENVLVSTSGNKLNLCDLHFNDRIGKLIYKLPSDFDWSEVDTIEKRDAFLNRLGIVNPENLLFACPGGIDPHVHFDTPGFEFREDFEHASRAALYGGTTTIIDMPCTSLPPVVSLKNLKKKREVLTGRSYIDYLFWGGVAGNEFNEKVAEKNIFDLADAGVAGFKVYMLSGMETFIDLSESQLEFVAGVIKKTGKPMAVHAEDRELVLYKEKRFKHMNMNGWNAYAESRDIQAELSAVNKLIKIAEKTDCRIHVVHLSSALALKAIREAVRRGVAVSAETCPHYLEFTQKDFENESIRNFLKTAPPVKFEEDREELWNGLADGSISFITTDHAGCNPEREKSSQNFWEVYGGIPGVEHRVPFLFSEGFLKGRINLETCVKLLSSNAADFFSIKSKGHLLQGSDADFILIDLWNSKIIKASEMHSKGKYTPYENSEFSGVIKSVYLRGNILLKGKKQLNGFHGQFNCNN